MANCAIWYKTSMPPKLIDIVRDDVNNSTKNL